MKPTQVFLAILAATGTLAANAQDLAIEEIVVTATKRPESMQDIPVAVSAFTGDYIDEQGFKDVRDIASQTPNLSVKSRGDTESSIFIRGIGSVAPGIGADPAVGVFIDGLYAARGTNATAMFFDLERIEVVKGPQGTLFGRNASAGAISIVTRKPEIGENYGSVLLGFGDEGQKKGEFIYNAGLSDNWAFRFGVKHDERDGLYTNEATGRELNGRDNTNVRASLLYDNGASYSSFLSAEYVDSASFAGFVSTADAFADVVRLDDVPAEQTLESLRVNWTNTWGFGDSTELTSITGYYDHDVNVTPVDADLVEFFVASFEEPQTAKFFSQELRLNGSNDTISWFAGGSYVNEELSFINDLNYDEFVVADLFGLNAADVDGDACNGTIDFGDGNGAIQVPVCGSNVSETPMGDGQTTSIALYGDVTWHLSDAFDLALGVRYTEDEKEMVYNNPASVDNDNPGNNGMLSGLDGQIFGPITPGSQFAKATFESLDPRVALNWHVSDGSMLYVSYAHGYKSGGLNRQFDPVAQAVLPFDKEENDAYEFGIKSTFWDSRARINAAIFSNDYSNFQLEELVNLVPQVNNIGDLSVTGLDMDFQFLLTEAFELWGNFALLDTEVKNAANTAQNGNKSPQAPETSGSLSGKYTFELANSNVQLSATWAYSDRFYFDLDNTFEQGSYSELGARLAWNNDNWTVALIGDNLTDEEFLSEQFMFLDVTSIRAPGRLARIEATYNF